MAKWNPDDFQKSKEDKHKSSQGDFAPKDSVSFMDDLKERFEKTQEKAKTDPGARQNFRSQPESSSTRDGNVRKKRKKASKRWGILILIFLVVVVLANSLYIVSEGQIAYLTQFGRIIATTEDAGLKIHLPFVQKHHKLSSKIMEYSVNPSEVLTADKKAMIVDSYVLWRIDDATRFIRTLSGNINEMQKRIDASVYSNIKNIMGGLQQSEIITDEESSRDNLNTRVTEFASAELESYGIEVLRVEIRRYDLPSDNLSAVYNRMISERQQMAAAYKADGEYEASKLRNQTDKECEILLGEADAEARRLQGQAEEEYIAILSDIYNNRDIADFYSFAIQLDTLKAALQGEKTVILGPDSPLGQMLKGVE